MKKYDRKEFIRTTGGVLAGAALAPKLSFSKALSSSFDTVTVALIGCRGMGNWMLRHALNHPNVVLGGLCDVDKNVLESRANDFKEITGSRPQLYSDYRKLLENKDIEAVIIATPDHWHCRQTVDALQAGKHVYVEKPMARTIAECEIMTRAADKYGKVLQVGQQQRSKEHWGKVVDMVRDGHVGKIRTIKLWANFGYGIGPQRRPDAPVPSGVDYDMWLGPAPQRPFNPSRFHGSWRFFWDYAGGLITDWGTHLLDIPLWAMNIEGPPKSVSSIGGIYSGQDRDIDMADTQSVLYEFDKFNMVWEHAGGIETGPYNRAYGVAFVGNKGTIVVNRQSWEVLPETEDEQPMVKPEYHEITGGEGHYEHMGNFLNAIRAGEALNCPARAGELAAFYGNIGNLAHRTGDTLKWDDSGKLMHRDQYEKYITPEYRSPWKLPKL